MDPKCNLITILDGISTHAQVTFEEGAEIDSQDETHIPDAAKLAAEADVAIVVLGLKTCQETGFLASH